MYFFLVQLDFFSTKRGRDAVVLYFLSSGKDKFINIPCSTHYHQGWG